MSEKIKTAYDNNPSIGNDPARTRYIPTDDGAGIASSESTEQLSNAVAYRLGLTGNISDPSKFNLRFPDDTLVAVVDPITQPYTNYVINTTGTTPTSGGLQGALSLTALDWLAHDYYLFISNDNEASYSQVLADSTNPDNDGNGALSLKANDALPPDPATGLSVAVGSAGSKQATVTFSDTPQRSGTQDRTVIARRVSDDTEVGRAVGVTSPVALTNLVDGVSIYFEAVLTGNNNLSSTVATGSVTIPINTTSTYDGKVSIRQQSYRELESAGSVDITIDVADSQTDNNVSVDVRTVDTSALGFTANSKGVGSFNTGTGISTNIITLAAAHGFASDGSADGEPVGYFKNAQGVTGNVAAIGATDKTTYYAAFQAASTLRLYTTAADAAVDDGSTNIVALTATGTETQYLVFGNFEAFSSVTVTVSVTSGVGSLVLPIGLVDSNLSANKVAQFELVPGSASGTADIAAFPDDATLFYEDGTGSASGTTYQVGDVVGGSTGKGVCMEAENASKDDQGLSGANTWNLVGTEPGPRTNANNNNTGVMVMRSGSFSSITGAPSLNFPFNTNGQTGTYYLYVSVYALKTWENKLFVGIDGVESFTNPAGEKVEVPASDQYKWQLVTDSSGNPITTNITVDGDHILNIWAAQDWVFIDKVILNKLSTLSPESVGAARTSGGTPDKVGPAENGFVPTVLTDDAANATGPVRPKPTGGDLAYTTAVPVAGAPGIGLSTPLVFSWPFGVTNIVADSFVEQDGSGNMISGTPSSASEVFTWKPTQQRISGVTYSFTASGTLVGTDLAVHPWSITGYTITAANISSSGFVYKMDLSGYADGQILDQSSVKAIFGSGGGSDQLENYANGNVVVATSGGQKVLRVKFMPDGRGTGQPGFPNGFQVTMSLPSTYLDLYSYFEMALSPNWISPQSIHLPFMRPGTTFGAPLTPQPDVFALNHQLKGVNAYVASQFGGTSPNKNSEDSAANLYAYDQLKVRNNLYGNRTDPTKYFNGNLPQALGSQTVWEVGVFHGQESRLDINTAGSSNGNIEGWFDSQKVISRNNIKLRGDSSVATIGKYGVLFWTGGNINDSRFWNPPASLIGSGGMYMDIRNIIIDTSPISH